MIFYTFLLIIHQLFSPWNGCIANKTINTAVLLNKTRVNSLLAFQSHKTLNERILFWSDFFKNVPYGIDPVGEGYGIDDDPIFNPCVVDCETYVEQVLALSFSKNFEEVISWLKKMRYKNGISTIQNRFYTMALSWLPANIQLGYLSEINLIRKSYFITRKISNKITWNEIHKKRLALMGENAPHGLAKVRYIPIDILIGKYRQIKTPAVAFIVRTKQAKNPFIITHMGFVLKNKKGKYIFRHASRTKNRRKVEERKFINYLHMLRKYFNNSKKPRRFVAGLAIYSITSPISNN